ncbi:MAG: efflux RND transporter periplasmic adaptor subunit [Balneolales bacterium]
MKPFSKQIIYGAGLLLLGLLFGYLIFRPSPGLHNAHDDVSAESTDQHVLEDHTDEEGNIVYTCSMHPSVREDEPGDCPICGMELIPVTSEARDDEYSMVMTEAAVQLANIQTTRVIEEVPVHEIRLPGRIKVDERRLTNITAHFPGRIQELFVNFTGAPIRAGEAMATIYSPQLVTTQRELLTAIRSGGPQSTMAESARAKLRQWELTDAQINEIVQSGEVREDIEIVSPANGYVMSRNFAREDHVEEGAVLFEIANLEQVWGVFEAYEEDLAWLREGDAISFSSRSNPGHQFDATIAYINPVVDPNKRTVQIRANIDNGNSSLKPEMLVKGIVTSSGQEGTRKLIPVSSVLWTGPRSVAFVKDPHADVPVFEAREIELGSRAGDFYIVHSGLEAGEEVVSNGAFRLDSEFQLADRFSMMNRKPGSDAVPTHDHGSMEDMPANEVGIDDDSEGEHGGH